MALDSVGTRIGDGPADWPRISENTASRADFELESVRLGGGSRRTAFLRGTMVLLAGLAPGIATAQPPSDTIAFVTAQIRILDWGQYMAPAGKCSATTVDSWKGFPTRLCRYRSNLGEVPVILLNADAERMGRWLVTACADARARFPKHCAERLALRVKCQSNNQFPVAGFVDEGPVFLFRDGVTVKITEIGGSTIGHKPSRDEERTVLSTGTVKAVGKYARVQGTTRAEYAAFVNRPESEFALKAWQKAIRVAYQAAWSSPRNGLMSAWAKANLFSIDHKLPVGARFDKECQKVARTWRPWPIRGE